MRPRPFSRATAAGLEPSHRGPRQLQLVAVLTPHASRLREIVLPRAADAHSDHPTASLELGVRLRPEPEHADLVEATKESLGELLVQGVAAGVGSVPNVRPGRR